MQDLATPPRKGQDSSSFLGVCSLPHRASGWIGLASLALVLLLTASLAARAAGDIHARVDELLLKGDFEAAIKLASEAYAQNPDDPLAICALACAYRNSSRKSALRVDAAALGLRADEDGVVMLDAQKVEGAFSQGVYYASPGREKALELYYENIKKNPLYDKSYYNLLNMYADERNPSQMVAVMRLLYQNLGPSDPAALLGYAAPFFNQGDHRSALIVLEGIMELYPDYAPALADAGSNHLLLGELREGQALLAKAFQLDPADPITAQSLLISHIYLKQFAAASELVAEVRERIPPQDLPPSFLLQGALASYWADRARARELFKEYAATWQDREDFWTWMVDSYLGLPEDSLGDFDLHAHLAGQYLENGYIAYGIIETELMKALRPDDPLGYYYQAGAYDQARYGPEVVQNLLFVQKYMEAHPGQFGLPPELLYYNLGHGYYLQRDLPNAIRCFERSLQLKQTAAVLYVLGLCYEDLNDLPRARAYYQLCSQQTAEDQLEWINRAIAKLKSPKFNESK